MLRKPGTYWAPPEYASFKLEKYLHAKHAVICIHFWFWISLLFKYAVRNSPALPLALSRCTLTLSLVLIELFGFKESFAMERRMSKYLNCKNTSLSEGRKIQGNFLEVKKKKAPHPQQANSLYSNIRSQHT